MFFIVITMDEMLNNRKIGLCYYFFLFLYYIFATHLPDSYTPIIGKWCNWLRIVCVRHIFLKCGKIYTFNRKVKFGLGQDIQIGDFSGIGANVDMTHDIVIGSHVMLGRQTHIFAANHTFDRKDVSMNMQREVHRKRIIIEDDCWIGLRVIILPGKIIRKGSIIGAGAVVTKNFEEYSVIGGNPAKLIRKR